MQQVQSADTDRHKLLVEWNDTKVEFPHDRCIHELFEEQAARRPEAAAVTFDWIGSRLRSSWRITRWLLGQEKYRVWLFFNRLRVNPRELTAVLDEEGMPLPGGMLDRVYRRIGESYRPPRLDSRGVLFRTDQINGNAILRDDDSLGWNDLFTRGLEIVPMIGDHLSMIRSHHSTLAREMNEVLKRNWPAN